MRQFKILAVGFYLCPEKNAKSIKSWSYFNAKQRDI
jgi:hypothetical protein